MREDMIRRAVQSDMAGGYRQGSFTGKKTGRIYKARRRLCFIEVFWRLSCEPITFEIRACGFANFADLVSARVRREDSARSWRPMACRGSPMTGGGPLRVARDRAHDRWRPSAGRQGPMEGLCGSPLGRQHEQGLSVRPPEHAGEATAVKVDRLQHLTALAKPHAAATADTNLAQASATRGGSRYGSLLGLRGLTGLIYTGSRRDGAAPIFAVPLEPV